MIERQNPYPSGRPVRGPGQLFWIGLALILFVLCLGLGILLSL
jgi:hypothetical protein